MTKKAVNKHETSIRLSSEAYGISEFCYRYKAKLSDEIGRLPIRYCVLLKRITAELRILLSELEQVQGLWLEPNTRLSHLS